MPLDLTGDKIRLRPLEARDLPALCQSYSDLDLQLTTDGDAPPMSDIQVMAFWNDILTNPGPDLRYFALEALPGQPHAGEIVGACSLQHIDLRNRHAELSIFMLSDDLRGLGVGTQAVRLLLRYGFEVLRLDKVYLGVYEFNEAGIRSYERVGFRYEGRLRHMLYYDGRYWDEWHMGILRSEWERGSQPSAEGLRPYHPADLDAALELIQAVQRLPDAEAARTVLRRCWRQSDRSLYAYQAEGKLTGLLTLATEGDKIIVLDVIGHDDFRAALQNILAALVENRPPAES